MTQGKIFKSVITTLALAGSISTVSADVILQDGFAYPNGNLVGNGGWVQNSTTTTNPIQVLGGTVKIGTSGQDAYNNFPSAITADDGTFAYYGLSLNLSAAQTAGDYFAAFTAGVNNPTLLSGRLFAKSGTTTGTFLLGYSESTNAGVTYGTDELTLGADYRVVLRYGFIAGTANDTGAIFVAPLVSGFDPVEANNIPYVLDSYNGTSAEIGNFTGFEFRQGTAGSAATVTADDLVITSGDNSNFTGAAVPEPTAALSLIGGIGMLLGYRRMRSTR